MNSLHAVLIFILFLFPLQAVAEGGNHKMVSLIKLSVHPERYEGKAIVAFGYFVFNKDAGEAMLFLTRDSYLSSSVDFIYIEVDDKFILQDADKIGEGYVYVSGVFTSSENISDGNCIGALRRVSSITLVNRKDV